MEELPTPGEPQLIGVAPPAVASRRNRTARWVLFARTAVLLVGVVVSAYLGRNHEMAENILRSLLKYVAENQATNAKNSQGQPEPDRQKAGDAIIPEAKNSEGAKLLGRRKRGDEDLIVRADQSARNGELQGG